MQEEIKAIVSTPRSLLAAWPTNLVLLRTRMPASEQEWREIQRRSEEAS